LSQVGILSCSDSVHTKAGWVCWRPRRRYRQSAVAISSRHRTVLATISSDSCVRTFGYWQRMRRRH